MSVAGVSFVRVIDAEVRALLAGLEPGGGGCAPGERVDRIQALDRAVNMVQAALSAETAAFAQQRRRADVARGAPTDVGGRGAPVEVAMARRVSKATIDHQLAFAEPLIRDLPRLFAACLDGRVSQAAAKYAVKACESLDHEQRQAIDPELAALACDLTPGELRKAADRLVASTDPDAAAKKAAAARADRQVRTIVNGDGTGTLLANLPVEQAVACWQTLDHEARSRRADGDSRSIKDLMCDVLVERVTGAAKATDLNLEVAVVISASSLFGVDDQPAKLVGHNGGGYGTVPAGLARQLAVSGSAWGRRLVCDPVDGRLMSMDTKKRRFDGPLRRFIIYRDGTSRRPYSTTPIYDIDHIVRHTDRGPTSAANGEGLGVGDHHTRDLPGWTVTTHDAGHHVTWTTPTGHTYISRPPPILGHGNTRTRRRQPGRIEIDICTIPIRADYAVVHRRRE
jgi:Domain of unknown function (DUF222)